MRVELILFQALMIGSAVFSSFILLYTFRRLSAPGAIFIILLQISMLLWTAGYIYEIAAPTLAEKLMGIKLQYFFGIPFAPVLYFFMIVHYATKRKQPDMMLGALVLIIPVLTMSFALSMHSHNFFYANPRLVQKGAFLLIEKDWGPWFFVHVYYSYCVVIATSVFVIRMLTKERAVFRTQGKLFILIMLLPWIANVAYVAGMSSFMRLDFSNISFIVSSAVMLFGIMRYQLLELLPAAHEKIIEAMTDGVIVVNSAQKIIEMNPAAEAILHCRQPLGLTVMEVFQNISAESRLFFANDERNFELLSGGKTLEVSVSPMRVPKGNEEGKIITVHDVTTRVKDRKELAELNAMKDKFISVLAHDLKSPFLGLNGLTEILIDEFSTLKDSEKIEMLQSIKRLSGSTYFMLENLLEWSRSLTGRAVYRPDVFLLSHTLQATTEQIRAIADLKKITIEHSVPPGCAVFADEPMMRAVMRNLLSNAVKFTPEYGRVSVDVHSTTDIVIVRVVDTGIGMTQKMIDSLSTGTIQDSRRGTAGEKGTGLGLLLCLDFIKKNNGKFSIVSQLGSGTSVSVTMPAATL